ncbi:MAG: thymidylate kinase, partial [Clostridia bacterium]|nr:thymidylate kinase [Clostridia bacterium]
DGSGKSTHVALVKEYLCKTGHSVLQIKLPHYEDESSVLVRKYLAGDYGSMPSDVNAYAASSFFSVDRYSGFKTRWGEAYLSGSTILCDRYTTSNAYHQMTKLPESEWDEYLDWLFDFEYGKLGIPAPDCVIYLNMPVEVSQRLMSERYSGDENKKDVHERNVQYLLSCRKAALYAAEKLGWCVIDLCENGQPRSIEQNSAAVCAAVERAIGK